MMHKIYHAGSHYEYWDDPNIVMQHDQHVYAFRRYQDEWIRREYHHAGE